MIETVPMKNEGALTEPEVHESKQTQLWLWQADGVQRAIAPTDSEEIALENFRLAEVQ